MKLAIWRAFQAIFGLRGAWMLGFGLAVLGAGAQERAPRPPPLPQVDPARELKGAALLDALRQGGLVLYMRHAAQVPPVSDTCDKPSLTPEGVAQAERVGNALRALSIPVGWLLTSEPCRNVDTAKLLGLGPFEINPDLNPLGHRPGHDVAAGRRRQLSLPPPPRSNTLLVSHMHLGVPAEDMMQLELAEIIVYRPGTGPVARIRVEDWDRLVPPLARD